MNIQKMPKFIKWAGGKSSILSELDKHFPKSFNNYIEPFVGGGSVFLHMLLNKKILSEKVHIFDINTDLINSYIVIRDNVEELIDKLEIHRVNHNKEYYLHVRGLDTSLLSSIERAARFIYLNKTCFNGLYRVNKKGQFNVPMGSYKNPTIYNVEKLKELSNILLGISISNSDFSYVLKIARCGDFIYFDPPYYTESNNFVSYNKEGFTQEDQEILFETFEILDKRGCYVVLSNSDTDFIKNLYSSYNIENILCNRFINSNSSGRGKINENNCEKF